MVARGSLFAISPSEVWKTCSKNIEINQRSPFFTLCIIKWKLSLLCKVLKAESIDRFKEIAILILRGIKCFGCHL